MSSLQDFQGVVPNLIFVVPESILNIFPLLLVCLVFVWGYMVVLLWKMPEHFHACSVTVFNQRQVGKESDFSVMPICLLIPFVQWRAYKIQLLSTRRRHRSQYQGIIFPPGFDQALKSFGSGEGLTHSPSSEQVRSLTMWYGGDLVAC